MKVGWDQRSATLQGQIWPTLRGVTARAITHHFLSALKKKKIRSCTNRLHVELKGSAVRWENYWQLPLPTTFFSMRRPGSYAAAHWNDLNARPWRTKERRQANFLQAWRWWAEGPNYWLGKLEPKLQIAQNVIWNWNLRPSWKHTRQTLMLTTETKSLPNVVLTSIVIWRP